MKYKNTVLNMRIDNDTKAFKSYYRYSWTMKKE